MRIALDSVSLNHLLRSYNAKNKSTAFDPFVQKKQLLFAIDPDLSLIDEWRETCSCDVVDVVVAHWEQYGAMQRLPALVKIPHAVARRLRQLGFGEDTRDKLLLKIAYSCHQRILVSNDGDFWNPKNKGCVGNCRAPVAKCCSDELGVRVWSLLMLFQALRPQRKRNR